MKISLLKIILFVGLCFGIFCDKQSTAPGSPPAAPTNFYVTPESGKIVLAWDTVPGANSYTIYFSTIPTVDKSSSSITVIGALQYTHEGLVNGQAYYYAISASNDAGESSLSTIISGTPVNTQVSPPGNIKIIPGDGSLKLSWNPAAGAFSYNIYYSMNPSVTKSSPKFNTTELTYIHQGLKNKTTYYYALSSLGNGTESNLSITLEGTPFKHQTPPTKVENLRVTQGDGSLSVFWRVNLTADYYRIYWSNTTPVDTSSSFIDSLTPPYRHSGLTNGRPYYYRVAGVNPLGRGPLSEEQKGIPNLFPPRAPSFASALSGNGQNTITWGTVSNSTSYTLYFSDTLPITKTAHKIANVTTPYNHVSLKNGQKYYYAVTASNGGGESSFSPLTHATPLDVTKPPLPPSIVHSKASDATNHIFWLNYSNATSYHIYWDTKSPVTKNAQKILIKNGPFTHKNLTNGTPYYYAIAGINTHGEGALSAEFTATPQIQGTTKPGMRHLPAKDITWSMGTSLGAQEELPVHEVKFTYDFYIDTTEVTQKQYSTVMKTAYPTTYVQPKWSTTFGMSDNHPAYLVNWFDAVLFCNARSKQAGLDTVYQYTSLEGTPGNQSILKGLQILDNKNGYRLPSEAEWEFACGGGTTERFFWSGDTINKEYLWYAGNSGSKTHEVATKKANDFGLYDMSGNVNEWCNDWYSQSYYSVSPLSNPTGPINGVDRVYRGASWFDQYPVSLYLQKRNNLQPKSSINNIGFRTVLTVVNK